MTLRQKYYFVASICFVILGLIIVVRAVLAQVPVIGILGAVLIALGVVRVRDFLKFRRGARDT